MQIISIISVEQPGDWWSNFKFTHSSRLHLAIPAAFFALVLVVVFAFEYYKDWKRKRRLNRYWQNKSDRGKG